MCGGVKVARAEAVVEGVVSSVAGQSTAGIGVAHALVIDHRPSRVHNLGGYVRNHNLVDVLVHVRCYPLLRGEPVVDAQPPAFGADGQQAQAQAETGQGGGAGVRSSMESGR